MPTETTRSSARPAIAAAASVGRDHLVLAGWFGLRPGEVVVQVRTEDRVVATSGTVLPELSPTVPGLVVVSLGKDLVRAPDVAAVRLPLDDVAGTDIRVCELPIEQMADDLSDVLRAGLSGAPATMRRSASDFLVKTLTGHRTRLPFEISRALVTARAILRERLPAAVIEREMPPTAQLDALARVDDHTFYVRGWIGYEASDLARLTLVSPEGQRTEVPPTMFRYARPDVARFYGLGAESFADLGLAALCMFDGPSLRTTGWLLEVETESGLRFEVTCPPAVESPAEVRDLLISDLALERSPSQALRVHHIAPAIARIQERANAEVHIARVEQFSDAPEEPDISIIVPLYQRIDFVEHQLAQFVHDPELRTADLIYVLDSPEQERQLVADSERLAALYGVPFRVVILSANGGFSAANNLGVSLARGRLVLLMNSDVFPDRPGWLGQLARFHDAQSNPGAVGPKLVYEDESLQHAGMYFERRHDGPVWFNDHFYKGLHRTLPAANVSRTVPAVSAACLLMRRDLYVGLGGLRGIYVQGDYEDSDLCLRVQEAGYDIWYAADVELYHLEGQSYPSRQRHANDEFNRWLHTHLWNSRIEAIMASHEADQAVATSRAGWAGA